MKTNDLIGNIEENTAAEVKGQTFCDKNNSLKIFLLCAIEKMTYEQYKWLKINDLIRNLEENAAAEVRGQICDGPISQNNPYDMI